MLFKLFCGLFFLIPCFLFAGNIEELKEKVANGDAKAQFELALRHYNGDGVTLDLREAVRLYRLSAKQGNVNAQNNLAILYMTGDGVKKNPKAAIQLFRLAAKQGNVK